MFALVCFENDKIVYWIMFELERYGVGVFDHFHGVVSAGLFCNLLRFTSCVVCSISTYN